MQRPASGYSPASGSQQSQSASTGSRQTGGGTQAPASPTVPQAAPTPGCRHVYLVSQWYPGRRSHWFLWIPSLEIPKIGRVIHVIGSVPQPYVLQIKDNHDMTLSQHNNQYVHLGQVPARYVRDGYVPHVGPAIYRQEGELRDDYDIAADALDPPRRDSFRHEPLEDPVWNSPHPRFERCQEWTRRLIADLVTDRKLPSTATQAMDTAISYTDANGRRFAYSHFAPPWGT